MGSGFDTVDCWLALARAPALHADHLRPHPQFLADPTQLLGQTAGQLERLGLPTKAAQWLAAPRGDTLAHDRRWLERHAVQLLHFGGPGFPSLLSNIAAAPLVLFVRGCAERLQSPQLAVVGSRQPTPAGRDIAYQFASTLAAAGLVITSGLAAGIDRVAHEAALHAGHTIAVLGTGLDLTYPPEHHFLTDQILAGDGALISEFPRGTTPHKHNFPRRNRLISGLALGTLVVEAAERSGSLITARYANEQGREVFAIPGSIRNPRANGCNALIKDGARLVDKPEEILADLNICHINQLVKYSPGGCQSHGPLDNDQKILLDALAFEPASADQLVERSGFSCQTVTAALLILELEGRVAVQAGGRYVRLT